MIAWQGLAIVLPVRAINFPIQVFSTAVSTPILSHFTISPMTNAVATLSVQITDMGAGATSLTSCKIKSARPNVVAELIVVSPDATHPEERFCRGQVSLSNEPYLPSISVAVTNDKGGSTSQTNPTPQSQPPRVSATTINGEQTDTALVEQENPSAQKVALSVTDVAGLRDCLITSEGIPALISTPINSYTGCSFSVSQIKGSFTLKIRAVDLLNQTSPTQEITINQKPAAPVIISQEKPVVAAALDKHINYLASVSSTGGHVVTGARLLPDQAPERLGAGTVLFWLGLFLLLASLGVLILLRHKKLWRGMVVVLLLGSVASLALARVALQKSGPIATTHLSVTAESVPQQKILDDSLITASANLEPGRGVTAPRPTATTSLIGGFKQAPEYGSRNTQFFMPPSLTPMSLFLQAEVGHSGSTPLWGSGATVTAETEYIKDFRLNSTGGLPGTVLMEVSQFPFPANPCTPSYSLYSQKVEVTAPQTDFQLDFKKFLPASYLMGQKTGTVPYTLRVAHNGVKAGCNDLMSNAVSTQALFNPETAPTSYASDARKLTLWTSGSAPRDSGELPNTQVDKFLDWSATNQAYNFEIDSAPYPNYGRWQVALAPFSDSECLDPQLQVGFADIDLTTVNPSSKAFSVDFSQVAINHTKSGTPSKSVLTMWQTIPNLLLRDNQSDAANSAQEKQLQQFLADSTGPLAYYIRFITLEPSTGLCDPQFKPTNAVKIRYGAPDPPGPGLPTSLIHEVLQSVNLSVTGGNYVPVRFQQDDFQPGGHYIYVRDYPAAGGPIAPIFHKGDKLLVPEVQPEQDKSFLDSVGDFVKSIGDFISAIGKVVSYVAEVYNGIKSGVVNGLAEGLSAIGVPCDSTCKAAISSGISVGQVALGIPPSLPNVDQLMSQGTDYMAAEVADQVADASGVPLASVATEQVAKQSIKQLNNQLKQAHDQADAQSPSPIVPDPDYLYHPAQIIVTVQNTSAQPARGTLYIRFKDTNLLAEADLLPRDLYKPVAADVPTLAPGATLKIPVNLEENYDMYRSHDHDYDPSVLCSGKCGDIISDPIYALQARKSRWMHIFSTSQVLLSISTGSVNKLPASFKPEDIGLNSSGWTFLGKHAPDGLAWLDKGTNTYHIFRPKFTPGKTLETSLSPNAPFEQ